MPRVPIVILIVTSEEEVEVRWVGGEVPGEVSRQGAEGALGSSGLSD